jgi:plasmid stabilization system protein ParE
LTTFPEAFPRVGVGDVRRLVVPQTPYVVYYEIAEGEIWIIAIFHAKQDRPWDTLSRNPPRN